MTITGSQSNFCEVRRYYEELLHPESDALITDSGYICLERADSPDTEVKTKTIFRKAIETLVLFLTVVVGASFVVSAIGVTWPISVAASGIALAILTIGSGIRVRKEGWDESGLFKYSLVAGVLFGLVGAAALFVGPAGTTATSYSL